MMISFGALWEDDAPGVPTIQQFGLAVGKHDVIPIVARAVEMVVSASGREIQIR